jgi:hypothetical protein
MKAHFHGQLRFAANEQTFLQHVSLPLRFGGADGYTHFLAVRSLYDTGFLVSAGGIRIPALRLRPAPIIAQLVDNQTGWGMESIPLEAALSLLNLKTGDIVPGSNCHGYTLTGDDYWIDGEAVDALLVGGEFVAVRPEEAEVAIFRLNETIVHSCLLALSHSGVRYFGKDGIGPVREAENEEAAARGNAYSHVEYYRTIPQSGGTTGGPLSEVCQPFVQGC